MFSGIPKESEVSIQPTNPEIEKVTTLATAYYLISVGQSADFFDVFNSIMKEKSVAAGYATKGESEILLLVEKSQPEFSFVEYEKTLKDVAGVKNTVCEVLVSAYSAKEKREKKKITSVLLMLVLPAKLEEIVSSLIQFENVVICYTAEGQYNLIVEVSADSFAETDKFIANHVAVLSGVLKLKELPLINLYD